MLTTSVDTIEGTDKGDIYYAFDTLVSGVSTTAVNAFDTLDGKEGNDILEIQTGVAIGGDPVLKSIETVNVKSATTVTLDGSNWEGTNTLNVTQATAATLTAAATTDVNVSGITVIDGNISVEGGKNIVINDAKAGGNITIGDAANVPGDATGTITITDTNNAKGVNGNDILVSGGTDVTVTTTADKASSGNITIGHATNGMATGNVVVTQNTTHNATTGPITAGNVDVIGGKTVEITANMTNTAVKGGAGANIINAGAYTVTAGDTTTDVTITQNATATDFENDAAAGTAEVSTVTFGSLKAGEKAIISAGALTAAGTDLTFTASKDLTAAEVAAAFANLTDGAYQASGGKVTNGTFTGKLDTGWTSGAVSGSSVTFTNVAVGNQASEITVSAKKAAGTTDTDNKADFKIASKTDGTAAGAPTAVAVTEDFGNVVVNDNATASITTITLDGFDNAALGASGSLNKLATLNLTNGQGTAAGTVLTSTSTTLTVNVDDMAGTVNLGSNVTTLTLNATGEASDIILDADKVETLTIAAGADLDLNNLGTDLAALKIATITGAGNVDLGDLSGSASFATLTASAATGDITVKIDSTVTAVTTGSGNDTITLSNTTAISKAIDLGAGDDTLVLFDDTTAIPTAAVAGGTGTDTISMTFTSAASYDGAELFKNAISGFERLVINNEFGTSDGVADLENINLANLGFASYVTTTGTNVNGVNGATATDILTLSQLAANATVVLTANGSITAALATATGTTDVINVIVDATNKTTAAGTFTVDDVETVKITAKGEFLDDGVTGGSTANDGIDDTLADMASLTLSADSVKTITIDGYADLTLDTDPLVSTVLTKVDAGAMTGALTYVADLAKVEVIGGSGADKLTASANEVKINGGAGNDIITINAGFDKVVVDGGTGNDTFVIKGAATTIDNYAVFNNVTAGDTFDFSALSVTNFVSTKVALSAGATESSQALTNEATKVLSEGEMGWFQYNGNTFIVVNIDGNGATADVDTYEAGHDTVVMITGLVDLSNASFNTLNGVTATDTLVIA